MTTAKLAERAALYCGAELPLLDGAERDFWAVHLAAFAAEEVARVREAQRVALLELRGVGLLLASTGEAAGAETVLEQVNALDVATTPERPARAKAKKLCACGQREPHEWSRECHPLSTLAKAAKKGKRRP